MCPTNLFSQPLPLPQFKHIDKRPKGASICLIVLSQRIISIRDRSQRQLSGIQLGGRLQIEVIRKRDLV